MIICKKELITEMIEHCQREFPNEACGILAGTGCEVEKIFRMANVDKSPERFSMDSKEQLNVMKEIRNLRQKMLGIYHSHVASLPYPSVHDVSLAFYPEVSYVIVSIKDRDNPGIRSFKIKEGIVSKEEMKIVEQCA